MAALQSLPNPISFMSKSKKDKQTTQPGAKNKSASRPRSYTPISDALSKPFTFANTELSEGIQRHGLGALLAAAMHRKRRCDGEPLHQVLCALLVWPLLKRNFQSILAFFSS